MIHSLMERKDLSELSVQAMEFCEEGVIITDAEANIVAVNSAMCQMTGYHRNEIIGNTPSIFKSGHHDEQFYQQMWGSLIKDGAWRGEILDRKPDGEITARQLSIRAVQNRNQETTHYIGLMHDNSQLKHMIELANRDPLTGLPNRRLFDERLGMAAVRARRSGKSFALLYIDLDDFKNINDTWGHLAGDKVLKTVADRIQSAVREDDTAARLGGDEFAVILSDVGNTENVELVINKIMKQVNKPSRVKEGKLRIGCSIGFGLFPDHSHDAYQLLEIADRDMFTNKKERAAG